MKKLLLLCLCAAALSIAGAAEYAKALNYVIIIPDKATAIEKGAAAELKLHLAKTNTTPVKLNGKTLRTLWCAPFSLDISEALVEGENELIVEVTSTWFNRLVYDAAQPKKARKTWTIAGPSGDKPLRESGLMGPVVIKY